MWMKIGIKLSLNLKGEKPRERHALFDCGFVLSKKKSEAEPEKFIETWGSGDKQRDGNCLHSLFWTSITFLGAVSELGIICISDSSHHL